VIIILIAIDFITKYMAMLYLSAPIFIMDIITLHFVKNHGIGFSLLSNKSNLYQICFGILAIIISLIILYKIEIKDNITNISIKLIAAGGLSNGIDRILTLGVTDFIGLNYYKKYFIFCNMADIYLTIGAFLIILEPLINKYLNNLKK